jgi:Yip1 domain.
MMNGMGTYSDYGLGSDYSFYGISQGIGIGAFFAVIFIAAASIILMLLFVWLMGKAFGGSGSFKKVWAATGPSTVYVSSAMLVSALFMAVSAALGIVIMSIVMSAASIICLVVMVKAFRESMSLDWNKAVFATASGVAVYTLAVMLLTALIAMA